MNPLNINSDAIGYIEMSSLESYILGISIVVVLGIFTWMVKDI